MLQNCWKYEIVSLSIPKVPGYILNSAGRLSGLKFLLIFMSSLRQSIGNISNFNVDWKKYKKPAEQSLCIRNKCPSIFNSVHPVVLQLTDKL